MSDIEVNQLLQQMRNMAAMSENMPPLNNNGEISKPDFGQLLKNSINEVNQVQKAAGKMTSAFESGDPAANLSEVMIAIQKASISFQAMTQVRNNLVSAYKEIMNMQV